MNKYHLFSLTCLIIGIIFLALGVIYGDVEAGFIIVFPFLVGSGLYAFFGFIFIFFAILLFIFGFAPSFKSDDFETDYYDQKLRKNSSVKGGGVVLIGPIPIVFGSNWKIAVFMMILAIIIIVLLFSFELL